MRVEQLLRQALHERRQLAVVDDHQVDVRRRDAARRGRSRRAPRPRSGAGATPSPRGVGDDERGERVHELVDEARVRRTAFLARGAVRVHHLEGVEALGERGTEEFEPETAPILGALRRPPRRAAPGDTAADDMTARAYRRESLMSNEARGARLIPPPTLGIESAVRPDGSEPPTMETQVRRVWRAVLDRIAPYEAGRPSKRSRAELGLPDLVRLSANENPLGPSPRVVEASRREADAHPPLSRRRQHGAARGAGPTARRRARTRSSSATAPTSCSAHRALAAFDPGDEIVVPEPSFEPYATWRHIAGAQLRREPAAPATRRLDDVRRRVTPRTKAMMLCSPHNPATTIIRRGPLLAAPRGARRRSPARRPRRGVSSTSATTPSIPTASRCSPRFPRLLVLRTFSKIAGLAGLRVGLRRRQPETIDRLNRVRAPYNVNRLGQVAALAAARRPRAPASGRASSCSRSARS